MPKIKNNEIEPEVLNNALIMRFRNSITALSNRDFKVIIASSAATLVFVFLLSLLGIDLGINGDTIEIVTGAQGGQIALTEAQLRAEVKKIPIEVFWIGPQSGGMYTLENQDNSRVFVRYLQNGKVPAQGEAVDRIVGTYLVDNAFSSTEKAGSTIANGIGFTNDDGAAVYYNSTSPNNVYVAFPNGKSQIEIFDPVKGVAVQLATAKGTIQAIK